jgi:precorrin-6B methylase 2
VSDGCAEAHLTADATGRSAGDLLNGYQDTALLYVAAKLGLADYLANAPKTSEELAAMTGAHAPSLYRILRGLVVVGMCSEDDGRFALTSLGQMLRTDVQGSLRNQALVCGDQYMVAWSALVHSAMTGETAFAHIFGVDAWEHRQRHTALSERFNADLNTETARSAAAIVEAYDFSAFQVVCDVGGGYGALLCAILAACPAMRGMLLEQAHVAIGARSYVESQGLGERCHVVEGDFFEGVPEGADTYVMKSIVHDWSEPRATTILGNCGKALRAGGRVILIERVMPALANDAPDTVRVDLHMLAVTGGRERSEAEYQQLLEAAGFSLRRIVATRSPFCVIEGVPR